MSKASEHIESIPLEQRENGYFFADFSRTRVQPTMFDTEVSLRYGRHEVYLEIHLVNVSQANRSYHMTVFLGGQREPSILLSSHVCYADSSADMLECLTTYEDESTSWLSDRLIRFIHVLLYSHLGLGRPISTPSLLPEHRTRPLRPDTIAYLEKQSKVNSVTLIEDLELLMRCLG